MVVKAQKKTQLSRTWDKATDNCFQGKEWSFILIIFHIYILYIILSSMYLMYIMYTDTKNKYIFVSNPFWHHTFNLHQIQQIYKYTLHIKSCSQENLWLPQFQSVFLRACHFFMYACATSPTFADSQHSLDMHRDPHPPVGQSGWQWYAQFPLNRSDRSHCDS